MIFNFFKKAASKTPTWENQFRIALGTYWGLSAEQSKNLSEFDGKCSFDENKTIPVDIRFPKNEKVYAVFHNLNLIKYVRDGRVSGAGITFRQKIVKGVYLRAGTGRISIPKSYQPVDSGSLYLTSVGIFFDGDKQNIKLPWDKIVKKTATSRAFDYWTSLGKTTWEEDMKEHEEYSIGKTQFYRFKKKETYEDQIKVGDDHNFF